MNKVLEQCEIEGCKRRQFRATFAFCSQCWALSGPAAQKKAIDAYLIGQEVGAVSPTEAFFNAIKEAKGDIYFKLIGTRDPSNTVKDVNKIPINIGNYVTFLEGDEPIKAKVIAVYSRTSQVTVRFWAANGYPRSAKLEADSVTVVQS